MLYYFLWILSCLLCFITYWYLSGPKNLPPGSSGIPLLGYLPFLKQPLFLDFKNLQTKFGNLYHLYLGCRLVVILNDFEAIKEAFVKQADIFTGRPADSALQNTKVRNEGIVATDGEYWKQHRRFILTNLRDYGVGKLLLEPLLLNEIHHFLAEIKKDENKSFPIKPLLMNSLANNIHILITGKRYDYGHPVMKEICQISKAGERTIQHVSLFTFFPWMRFVPGSAMLTNRKKARAVLERILEITKNILNDVKTEFKDGESGIYIHAYLTEQRKRKKLNDEENIFTATGLHHITRDLLMAGTETSATTLHWSLLYLTRHPEVQEKLQKEIDQVIGKEREPSFNDRTKMPYTEAVICEVHRVISLVPMSFPHRTIRDTQIYGSFIPKDTLIIPNIYAVHNDEKTWGDPHNFRPERFISPDGQFVKSEHVIPFSIGKRACAGEPLARMELFLYLVSLFQHFTFVPPDGVMPSLDSVDGIIQRPVFQNICAISRD